jgi:hypothetical protein
LLPQVHDGRHEALIMLGPPENNHRQSGETIEANKQPVLRLWNSGVVLDPDEDPLWIGYVTLQTQRQILFLRLPFALKAYDEALETLKGSVSSSEQRVVNPAQKSADGEPTWNGEILLLRDKASSL